MHVILRGISNLEDVEILTKKEVEEVVRVDVSGSEMPLVYLFSSIDEPVVLIVDWLFISPMLLFLSGLFADFEILDTVEMPPDIRSGS